MSTGHNYIRSFSSKPDSCARIHCTIVVNYGTVYSVNVALVMHWYQVRYLSKLVEMHDANMVASPEYTFRIPDRQSSRIKQRMQFNWEVQILGGIQKQIGFPAAPDVNGATEDEKDEDFEALDVRCFYLRFIPRDTAMNACDGNNFYVNVSALDHFPCSSSSSNHAAQRIALR